VEPRELNKRREAAQRDAAGVKPAARRIRLLNTPPHRNLDGELGEDHDVDMKRDRDPGPNARVPHSL
jgi:hypothetical protein